MAYVVQSYEVKSSNTEMYRAQIFHLDPLPPLFIPLCLFLCLPILIFSVDLLSFLVSSLIVPPPHFNF